MKPLSLGKNPLASSMPIKDAPTASTALEKAELNVLGSPLKTWNKPSVPTFPLLIVLLLASKEEEERIWAKAAVPRVVQGDQSIDARAYHQCHHRVLTTGKYR